MQPDLSPHLHTEECNFLIGLLMECYTVNKFKKFFGACNYWDEAVWQCTKQERIMKRKTNSGYNLRRVGNRRLPEEQYTTPLKRLKEQGLLNLDGDNTSGCKI